MSQLIRLATSFALCVLLNTASFVRAEQPIPEKTVVLTFDDSVKSHFTVVRPILKKYKFGATFFITQGFDFKTNKRDYMTWEQIAQLDRDGFEIGNHTQDHLSITADKVDQLKAQLDGINKACEQHGIRRPTSFAWPGNAFHASALPILKEQGVQLARRGGTPEYPYKKGRGFGYEPGLDHPLLIPTAGDARPDWEFEDFKRATEQARYGRVAVLQFHGVPDNAHPWVNTARDKFEQWMRYLAVNEYRVIALRDLAKFEQVRVAPRDPEMVIRDRQELIAKKMSVDEGRPAANKKDRRRWLESMLVQHRYSPQEAAAALRATTGEVKEWIKEAMIDVSAAPATRTRDGRLIVHPFPGGRHPRIGFRDGAIRPQRETKVSVFAPWANGGYAVVDVPEAIWVSTSGNSRRLLYLAHTHVPTLWDDSGTQLEPLEWKPVGEGEWEVERTLPNQVTFGARVSPRKDGVAMRLWLTNGGDKTLRGLAVQNCVMLKSLRGFEAVANDNQNKRFAAPYAACQDESGKRWVITAWSECKRPWGNVHCPCLHADPQFPDCKPGETQSLHGWVSFYEGDDLDGEFQRLNKLGWDQGFSSGKN